MRIAPLLLIGIAAGWTASAAPVWSKERSPAYLESMVATGGSTDGSPAPGDDEPAHRAGDFPDLGLPEVPGDEQPGISPRAFRQDLLHFFSVTPATTDRHAVASIPPPAASLPPPASPQTGSVPPPAFPQQQPPFQPQQPFQPGQEFSHRRTPWRSEQQPMVPADPPGQPPQQGQLFVQQFICDKCHKVLPNNVQAGDFCPHCGAYFASKTDMYGHKEVAPAGSIPINWQRVLIAAVTAGTVGIIRKLMAGKQTA